ncbi:MAG: hypothetical protein JW841_12460 [Deltaproteobacteria bacterium]|nr:hypothetical protein [Deltaproteobacteria bacterium]
MKTIKTITMLAVFGALCGAIAATLIAPSVIAWYQTPGTSLTAMCLCTETVQQATARIIQAQLSGAIGGIIFFFIIGLIIRARRHRRAKAKAAIAEMNINSDSNDTDLP